MLRHHGGHPEYRGRSGPNGTTVERAPIPYSLQYTRVFPVRLAALSVAWAVLFWGRARTRPVAECADDRAPVWISGDELDARHLDRRGRPDRVRAARDPPDVAGSRRRAELPGVDRRGALRVAREHHRPPPGRQDVLVLRNGLHLHPRGQLDQPPARRGHDRLGPRDRARLRRHQPFFRGANADLNLTLAMALVFFALWIYWAIQEVGVGGMAKELFAPKGETTGALKVLMIAVFFAAGCLEIISILFRPDLTQLPPVRQRVRRRKHARNDGCDGAGSRVAAANPVLFHGAARGAGAGDGLHVADSRLHPVDLSPRRERWRWCARLTCAPAGSARRKDT